MAENCHSEPLEVSPVSVPVYTPRDPLADCHDLGILVNIDVADSPDLYFETTSSRSSVTDVVGNGWETSSPRQNEAGFFTRSCDVIRKRDFLYTSLAMCKIFGRMFIDAASAC
jgi:hypothetical protein